MSHAPRDERVRARAALTVTGGFLAPTEEEGAGGFTHTFNPAIGCAYARGLCGSFCYAREFALRSLGPGAWGERVAWKENAPELLARELARAARRPADHRHHLARIRVFSSSK